MSDLGTQPQMCFSARYLYCPGEFIIHSGKEFFHWKTLQIEFEKCNFGKSLSKLYYLAPPKFFFGPFSRKLWRRPCSRSLDNLYGNRRKMDGYFPAPPRGGVISLEYPELARIKGYRCFASNWRNISKLTKHPKTDKTSQN